MAAKDKDKDKFKKGDLVFWTAKINGILRKYEGEVLLKVNKNQSAEKVIKKINKKLYVSKVFEVTSRAHDQRNDDSYIIETMNTDGEKVLHWPVSSKLQLSV